jgi:hypothetical protein
MVDHACRIPSLRGQTRASGPRQIALTIASWPFSVPAPTALRAIYPPLKIFWGSDPTYASVGNVIAVFLKEPKYHGKLDFAAIM